MKLAKLKAQAASLATGIANCVKGAREDGDPDIISDILTGFMQAQVANAKPLPIRVPRSPRLHPPRKPMPN